MKEGRKDNNTDGLHSSLVFGLLKCLSPGENLTSVRVLVDTLARSCYIMRVSINVDT